MKIDVIDIGIGNISSIENWLTRSNINCNRVSNPNDLNSDLVILPGVGSAKLYAEKLLENKFDTAIKKHLANGGRLIGICLGFQILFDHLEEDGGVKGLGILRGKVELLESGKSNTGWGDFFFNKNQLSPNWISKTLSKSKKKIIEGRVFYNHNYAVITADPKVSNFKIPSYNSYSSFITSEQIVGFQFHPEKSQWTGQTLIEMIY